MILPRKDRGYHGEIALDSSAGWLKRSTPVIPCGAPSYDFSSTKLGPVQPVGPLVGPPPGPVKASDRVEQRTSQEPENRVGGPSASFSSSSSPSPLISSCNESPDIPSCLFPLDEDNYSDIPDCFLPPLDDTPMDTPTCFLPFEDDETSYHSLSFSEDVCDSISLQISTVPIFSIFSESSSSSLDNSSFVLSTPPSPEISQVSPSPCEISVDEISFPTSFSPLSISSSSFDDPFFPILHTAEFFYNSVYSFSGVHESFPFSIAMSWKGPSNDSENGALDHQHIAIVFPKGNLIPGVKTVTFYRCSTFFVDVVYANIIDPCIPSKISTYTVHESFPFSIAMSWKGPSNDSENGALDHQHIAIVFPKGNLIPGVKTVTFYRCSTFFVDVVYANIIDPCIPSKISTYMVFKC
ncbi:Heat shock 70 kDa protein 15 [Platanthera guangdongensis]|uniref:Heat shock 70 kDa protein 15 n=1 Tax=Platanthera guangdongensis TaxID=2320717 RepID=A0ABR2MJ63_9ASPA